MATFRSPSGDIDQGLKALDGPLYELLVVDG
jgi:hypothetical protein